MAHEMITVYTGKHAGIFGRLRFATLMTCIFLPPGTFIYSRHRYYEDYRKRNGRYPYGDHPDLLEHGWQTLTNCVERMQEWAGLSKLSDLQELSSSSNQADGLNPELAPQWTMKTAYQRSLLGMRATLRHITFNTILMIIDSFLYYRSILRWQCFGVAAVYLSYQSGLAQRNTRESW